MRFLVTVRKLNVTDRQRRTDRRTDRGCCNISRPGPSAPREIKMFLHDRCPFVVAILTWVRLDIILSKCPLITECPLLRVSPQNRFYCASSLPVLIFAPLSTHNHPGVDQILICQLCLHSNGKELILRMQDNFYIFCTMLENSNK